MFKHFSSRKQQICVYQAGRFGNQLFQLAAALTIYDNLKLHHDSKISHKIYWHGVSPEIEKIGRVLAVPIKFRRNVIIERLIAGPKLLSERSFVVRAIYSIWWRWQRVGAHTIYSDENILNEKEYDTKKILLSGYFHNYRIARSLIDRCENVKLADEFFTDLKLVQLSILKDEFIAVHLRFGDYLVPGNKIALGELGSDYYGRAIDLFSSFNKNQILIFSDDPVAAKEKLSYRDDLEIKFAKDFCDNFFEEFCFSYPV
jgi:hypothetical protein